MGGKDSALEEPKPDVHDALLVSALGSSPHSPSAAPHDAVSETSISEKDVVVDRSRGESGGGSMGTLEFGEHLENRICQQVPERRAEFRALFRRVRGRSIPMVGNACSGGNTSKSLQPERDDPPKYTQQPLRRFIWGWILTSSEESVLVRYIHTHLRMRVHGNRLCDL